MNKFLIAIICLFSLSTNAQVKRQLAEQAMEEGRFEEALNDWEDLYEKQPNDFYYQQIVACFIQLEEYGDATDFIEDHIDEQPARAELYRIDLGYIHLVDKDTAAAEDEFNRVLEAVYRQPGLAYQYSERFKKWGIFKFALATLETAERGNPNMSFDQQKALLYAEMGMLEEMYIAYLDALARNPNFLASYQNVIRFNMNRDGNIPKSDVLKREIIGRIQDGEGISFNRLLIWVLTQEGEYGQAFRQLKALYRREEVQAFELFSLAQSAQVAKAYDDAIQIYAYLETLGNNTPFYADAVWGEMSCKKSMLIANGASREEFLQLNTEMKGAAEGLRASSTLPNLLLANAELQFLQLQEPDSALRTLEKALSVSPEKSAIHAESMLLRGDIELAIGLPYDAILTYSQVEADFESALLGQDARFRKARVAFYTGDFEWALTMFDVLKKSTSKLISNDALRLSLLIKDNAALDTTYLMLERYASALLYQTQNRYDEALSTLDTLDKLIAFTSDHPLHDESMYTRATIFNARGEHLQAAQLFEEIEAKFPKELLADEALIRAARIYQHELMDLDKAKALYEKVLLQHNNSIYAEEARSAFRKLRGDLNS
ncbi:tetratricopeptide repeat protein [Phaeocystidibacter luteus]|uniref:Tetratricopeptide repeat protein n=1 Tax=Phaeocystidibacter luteus TaxID=911197 RepID=A0A6N6RJ39_9FLAO|nr:tetratricopeptide repeat protein [Phaeocystidibacter luteus]KAB2810341.1 tetratricopeptide repeat protein [Phaeocystidibacter luteus]